MDVRVDRTLDLVASRDVTWGDLLRACEILGEYFADHAGSGAGSGAGSAYAFRPEPTPEGGILWARWPGRRRGAAASEADAAPYKSARLVHHGGHAYPSLDGPPVPPSRVVYRRGRLDLSLRSGRGAPAWTPPEARLFLQGLEVCGLVRPAKVAYALGKGHLRLEPDYGPVTLHRIKDGWDFWSLVECEHEDARDDITFWHNRNMIAEAYRVGCMYGLLVTETPQMFDRRASQDPVFQALRLKGSTYSRATQYLLPCFCVARDGRCEFIWTHSAHRRRGLATLLLEQLDVASPGEVVPSAEPFWKACGYL